MHEKRKAARFAVHVPMHVCVSKDGLPQFHSGQLRDISRTGILFHSENSFEPGASLELTFCLPAEKDRTTCTLVRASSKTLRISQLPDETTPRYAVAVVIDHIDFLQPDAAGDA
ncbi:MAG: PilZ domain-containing protein [Candidatus Acidiferrales bacterium]